MTIKTYPRLTLSEGVKIDTIIERLVSEGIERYRRGENFNRFVIDIKCHTPTVLRVEFCIDELRD